MIQDTLFVTTLKANGFSNIEKFRANVKGSKPGTLVISGVFDNDEQC